VVITVFGVVVVVLVGVVLVVIVVVVLILVVVILFARILYLFLSLDKSPVSELESDTIFGVPSVLVVSLS
jgi:hypothetical protein